MMAPSEKSETSQRSVRRAKTRERKTDGGGKPKSASIKIKEPHCQKRWVEREMKERESDTKGGRERE